MRRITHCSSVRSVYVAVKLCLCNVSGASCKPPPRPAHPPPPSPPPIHAHAFFLIIISVSHCFKYVIGERKYTFFFWASVYPRVLSLHVAVCVCVDASFRPCINYAPLRHVLYVQIQFSIITIYLLEYSCNLSYHMVTNHKDSNRRGCAKRNSIHFQIDRSDL